MENKYLIKEECKNPYLKGMEENYLLEFKKEQNSIDVLLEKLKSFCDI